MSTPPLPLLITGVAGVAGYNAFHFFRRRYGSQVIGIRRRDNWPLQTDGLLPCDIEDADAMADLWDTHGFRSVIHCAGTCRLKSCQLDPAMAHRVNVVGTTNVAEHARRRDAAMIHLSIDLVFAGRDEGGYTEEETPDPVTVYGETMVTAEHVVRQRVADATILRISLPMGISFNGHAGAVDWIASRFRKNKPATLYYDEVRTPTYTDCLNRLLDRLLKQRLPGLYHAGGPGRLSLYHIAQIVNRVGGYDPELLIGCPRRDAGPMPPRAGNVSLDSSKLCNALGGDPFHAWPVEGPGFPDERDWHFTRSNDEPNGETWLRELLYQNPRRGDRVVPPARENGNGRRTA